MKWSQFRKVNTTLWRKVNTLCAIPMPTSSSTEIKYSFHLDLRHFGGPMQFHVSIHTVLPLTFIEILK